MIVLFSSNVDGGILQLEIQLLEEINQLGKECCCLVPDTGKVTIPQKLVPKVLCYKKVKTIRKNDIKVKEILHRILSVKPDAIWYLDSSVLSMQMCNSINGEILQFMIIHDPNGAHPTNQLSFKNRLQRRYENWMLQRSMSVIDKVYLLSEESYKAYIRIYPNFRHKAGIVLLGAHVPDVTGRMPDECRAMDIPCFLFFGRIDKYKGISTMLKAYRALEKPKFPLVIAGRGSLTDEEKRLAEDSRGILLINRYIDDAEMVWLFENAAVTVLPYIEASQSGVIPISYKFGVPVITSDVEGLTQFVDDKKTGFVCKREKDYQDAMKQIQNSKLQEMMAEKAKEYYISNLDWHNSLEKLLEEIRIMCDGKIRGK